MENYESIIQERILDVALKRQKPRHNPPLTKILDISMVQLDKSSGLFFVDSETHKELSYMIDAELHMCSCKQGKILINVIIFDWPMTAIIF